MGKGYIGHRIFDCMADILLGDISLEQIDKIYSRYSYTKDSLSRMLDLSSRARDYVAQLRAEKEIAKNRGLSEDDFYSIYDEDDYDELDEYVGHTEEYCKLREEVEKKKKELLPTVKKDAENVLRQSFESGKIVSIKYRIPEGETIEVNSFPDYGFDQDGQIESKWFYEGNLEELVDKIEVTGGKRIININDEVLKLGDKYYAYETEWDNTNAIASLDYMNSSFSSGPLSNNNWLESELDLIVLQLKSVCDCHYSQPIRDKAFLLGEVFPKYKDAIKYVAENMSEYSDEKYLKELFEEALGQTNEHTSDEAIEAAKDVSQREFTEVLDDITNLEERISDEQEQGFKE